MLFLTKLVAIYNTKHVMDYLPLICRTDYFPTLYMTKEEDVVAEC